MSNQALATPPTLSVPPSAAGSATTPVALAPPHVSRFERGVTMAFVVGPVVALVAAVIGLWGHGVGWVDLALAAVLYVVVGYGIAIGYHRLFTHRSFTARRPLKIALAIVGSLALEGGPIGWVADHRRHHAFTDRPGDPHSPVDFDQDHSVRLRGLWHAHVGWLFKHTPTSPTRFAKDVMVDRDLVVIDRLFPLFCVASLAVPFAAGYALGHTLGAAITALVWAGGVRILVLHHVTWSVNSVGHWIGRRPFDTNDHSTNFAPMAVLSFGEAWHNNHHAYPRSARHGMFRHQPDPSAALIRIFERLGWARDVVWPTPAQLGRRVAPVAARS
jgi:stearoyl-CoA desaturase (Delta-9 desaturase)